MNKKIETPDIDSSSDDYATRFLGKTGKWFLKVQDKATLMLLNKTKTTSILDVGGGHGQTLPLLIKNNYHVTILGSDESCSHRIKNYLDNNLVIFKEGNLTAIPFPDQAFDTTISYRILPHLNNWKGLIKELTRTSKNSVMIDFPTVRSINFFSSLLFNLKKKIETNTRPYTLFKEAAIINEFKLHDFIPVAKYPQFLFPMALHRALNIEKISKFLEFLGKITGLTYLFGSPIIYLFKRDF